MKAALLFLLLFVSQAALAKNEALLAEIERGAEYSESDSLVVQEDGRTLVSRFYHGPDGTKNVQSITKSICGLAIAALVEDGLISSFDTPMSRWFPDWAADPRKSRITLRMLLNHTSGLPEVLNPTDFWRQHDIVGAAANTDLIAEPGSQFLYSSLSASLLQRVIAYSSAQSPTFFVRTRLLQPIGIDDFYWNKDDSGHEQSSGGMFFSTASLVRIGELMLGEGSLDGRQVLKPSTVKMLAQKSQPYADYGLLWWLFPAPRPALAEFSAIGWGGQYITVLPSKRLIVVRTKDPNSVDPAFLNRQNFHELPNLISRWE